MAKANAPETQQESEQEHLSEQVFTSEKREDVWAIIIAMLTLILSVTFPDQIYDFFKKALYLF
jgi:hypothetical protein